MKPADRAGIITEAYERVGFAITPEEIAVLTMIWTVQEGALRALHDVDEARYIEPAIHFSALVEPEE